jgi:voltage-gated potassium channel
MTRESRELESAARLLVRTAGLIAVVFVVGVVGYALIGGPRHGLVDAVYMTLITLTTVGYGEVIDLSGNPAGRVFTMLLLVAGVGSFVYFFSNLTAFMVEGHLDRLLTSRRMKKRIADHHNHFIVCGAGSTGRHVVRELLETERPLVVVDEDEDRLRVLGEELGREFPVVVGDATDDDTLKEAGVERAGGLVACIANDKDNLIVTVSARLLNPDLRIICRCIEEKVRAKIEQAGADAVVSPNMIGGLRIVSELVRPRVVSFLDTMLRDRQEGLRVEECLVDEASAFVGESLGDVRARGVVDVLIVAVRQADGSWSFNPRDEVTLAAGMSIIFMANPEGRAAMEAAGRRTS